jgi:hypothetical protein
MWLVKFILTVEKSFPANPAAIKPFHSYTLFFLENFTLARVSFLAQIMLPLRRDRPAKGIVCKAARISGHGNKPLRRYARAGNSILGRRGNFGSRTSMSAAPAHL